ncbi:LOW QUALITY PROTEIN: hypothetical protein U9M48_028848, partial [Paspalum notatum var. saurae]
MLAIMINRAKDAVQIEGLIPHRVEDGLSILQYAGDTIVFLEHDFEQAKNLKLLLCTFEQLLGLKINFHKSELFCFGHAKQEEEAYSHLFGCSLDLVGGKVLSVGGKLVLVNSVLSSLSMFMLSFFEVPKEYFKRWIIIGQGFIGIEKNRDWLDTLSTKISRGLGIMNLELQNKCLLSKWLFRLCNKDGVWQQLIRNKYLKSKNLSQVEKRLGDSHFWSGLMEIKGQFLNLGRSFKLLTVKRLISFRRALLGDKLTDWHNLVRRVLNISLQEGNDVFKWDLHRNGCFSVRSMYKYLVNNNILKGVLLTKDNLGRRNWHRDKTCVFYRRAETIQYLFFECQFAKVGKSVALYFCLVQEGCAGLYDFLEMILFFIRLCQNPFYRGTHWLRSWAKLQPNEDHAQVVIWGRQRLETVALQVFASFGWPYVARLSFP